MSSHNLQYRTVSLPVIPRNPNSGNNTNENLHAVLQSMYETPEYKRVFNPETGKLVIWYMMSDDNGCKITLWNTDGSCSIEIVYFCLDENKGCATRTFNQSNFLIWVNKYLLTREDLAEQIASKEREQMQKDALKKAHIEKTCDSECEFCKDEARNVAQHEEADNEVQMTKRYGPNWRQVLGLGLGYT